MRREGSGPVSLTTGESGAIVFYVNGAPVRARAGQSVAAALAAEDRIALRRTRGGALRGVFCGMGVCYDCLVTVDGRANERACLTTVREGMRVELPGIER